MNIGMQPAEASGSGSAGPERAALVEGLLGQAWKAWDVGDAEGLLALIAQARALGPLDVASVAWMEEAEAVAREQADVARYQRARSQLREGDLVNGLRTWLDLSASARAAIRVAFDLPEFRWLEQMDVGRVDAALALGRAQAQLAAGDLDGARAILEPHRRLLDITPDGRAAFERLDAPLPAEAEPAAEAVTELPDTSDPLAEPPPAVPIGPVLPPASANALAALASHMASGGAFKVEAPSADWALVLAMALRDLLPGKDVEGDLDRIQAAIDRRDTWKALSAPIAVRLIELIAARLRTLQLAGVSDRRVDLAFSTVSAWSKREKPGFAHGLMRDHRPVTGSWDGDVDAAVDDLYDALPVVEATPKVGKRLGALETLVAELATCPAEVRDAVRAQIRTEVSALLTEGISARHTRLVHIIAPVAEELTGPDMRALRRAGRAAALKAESGATEEDEADAPIPEDWAWWPVTRGRRAVMVGGDPREPNRVRLERAFGLGELAWEQAEHSRNSLQKVRDRVKAGGVDLVVILSRFVGHDADQVILPACKDAGVPFVPVKSGYGVVGIRRAIERYVAR